MSNKYKNDRFYKTHLKWGHIKNSVAPKFYKFFIIYNFLKFKKLSTKRFPKNILNSVFFKLVLDQILPKNLDFDISFKDNAIKYQKSLNFFSFQNVYKNYTKSEKISVLFRSLYLFNQKNWNYWPDWKKKNFLDSIKYYLYLKDVKKYDIHNIKGLEKRLYDINLYFISYKEKNINYFSKFIKIYNKLIYLYVKYIKYHKNIYPHKHFIVSSSRATDFINKLKYNIFLKNILYFLKSNVDKFIWETNKFNIFIFINLLLKINILNFSFFNKFIFLFFLNIFLKIFKDNTENHLKNTEVSLKSVLNIFKRIDKKMTKKQELYNFVKSFLMKKKKLIYYSNKFKKKKRISLFNSYSPYKFYIEKHPFYSIINYEYSLYLKKNPYQKYTLNFLNWINFDNFIKYKRKNIINNINWKIFYKYSPNNKFDFFRDLFIRYKSFLNGKTIYNNIEYNSLFYKSQQKNLITDPKYYLGWFVFNQPIKLKNWFYQKDFFLFPSWFYDYKKKKNPFIDFDYETFQKEMKQIETELYKDIKNSIIYSKYYRKYYNINKNKSFLKSILNFYRVAANNKIYRSFKKDLLIEKLLDIDKYLTLDQKENIINKIRYHKFIKWANKKKFINSLENRFNYSLTFEQKKVIIKNIFETKRYDFEEKKKIVDKKINHWNKLKKLSILRQKRIKKFLLNNQNNEDIKLYSNIIKFNNITKFKKNISNFNKKKDTFINHKITSHYLIFNKIYCNKLLNNIKINSSLNNLFNKFYNVPKISNYYILKIFLMIIKYVLKI